MDVNPFFNYQMLLHVTRTRTDTLDFLVLKGLLNKFRRCHKGKHSVEWIKNKKDDEGTCVNRIFRCRSHSKSNLYNGISASNNTWFEYHKISCEDVLKITYYFSRNYSYKDCQHEIRTANIRPDGTIEVLTRLTLSKETIADIYSYCRETIMVGLDRLFEEEGRLGGVGKRVQIDEMKFGKWKYHRGRYVDGHWIFGVICEETKDLRLEIIPNNCRSQENMRELIEKYIEPGTTIVSDAAKFYHNIGSWGPENGPKYTHLVVNHSDEISPFVNEDGDHTNLIESTWRTIRQYIGLGRIQETLDYHLCEILWRRRCDKKDIDPFLDILELIRQVYPPPN